MTISRAGNTTVEPLVCIRLPSPNMRCGAAIFLKFVAQTHQSSTSESNTFLVQFAGAEFMAKFANVYFSSETVSTSFAAAAAILVRTCRV